MNREEIIKLAREAGLSYGSDEKPLRSVIRFAALAAEHEREACALIVEADGRARGREGLVLIKAAGRIRARGEK